MQKLNFSIDIRAPKERVWKTLWDDTTYREWTNPFHEGSHAVSDWKEGSQVLFLDADGNGMSSVIDKKVPNEFMSFRVVGMVKNGKEEPEDKHPKEWLGYTENYTLRRNGEMTKLTVDVDVLDDHVDSFKEAFPKGLQKVKDISERTKEPVGIH